MASNGIRDRVAIVGMGCTPFAEHWDKGVNDLLVDAAKDATASAGIDVKDIDALVPSVARPMLGSPEIPESFSFSTPMAMATSYAPEATA